MTRTIYPDEKPASGPGTTRVLRKAVGFRNVLVHGHVDVDDGGVTARLEDLSDLRDHGTQVARWMSDDPSRTR